MYDDVLVERASFGVTALLRFLYRRYGGFSLRLGLWIGKRGNRREASGKLVWEEEKVTRFFHAVLQCFAVSKLLVKIETSLCVRGRICGKPINRHSMVKCSNTERLAHHDSAVQHQIMSMS